MFNIIVGIAHPHINLMFLPFHLFKSLIEQNYLLAGHFFLKKFDLKINT